MVKLTTAAELWKEILWRKPVGIILGAVTLLSTASWLWDEFVRPVTGLDRPSGIALLGRIAWYSWVIFLLALLIVTTGQHAHKLILSAERRANNLENPQFNFVITHVDTPQVLNNGQVGIHRRIMITNKSDSAAINCELVVEKLSIDLPTFTRDSALPVKDGGGALRGDIHQNATLLFDLFVTFIFPSTDVAQATKLCTSTWPMLPYGDSEEIIYLRFSGQAFSPRRFQVPVRKRGGNVEVQNFTLQV